MEQQIISRQKRTYSSYDINILIPKITKVTTEINYSTAIAILATLGKHYTYTHIIKVQASIHPAICPHGTTVASKGWFCTIHHKISTGTSIFKRCG